MINKRVIELINKEVDGFASAEETARLKAVLRENPEARKLFDEISSLADAMAGVARADPPPTLQPSIMRALNNLETSKKRMAGLSGLVQTIRSSVLRNPGFVFAGGLAVGLLIFVLSSNIFITRSVDESELTGTLVLHGPVPGFSPGDLIDINRDDLKGSIETQFSPGLCLLRLRLETRDTVSVSILTDAASVHIEAIRPTDDSGARLSFRDGELTLGGTKSGGVVVIFSRKGKLVSPARLRVASLGRTVFDADIALEKAE